MRMAEDTTYISSGVLSALGAVWGIVITAVLGFMSYFAKKRDNAIDDNAKAASDNVRALAALELKIAENYATKPTVLALFQEATTQTKEAVARVEKSIDSTNDSVGKLDLKIDKVVDSISAAKDILMKELSKKT